jgi:hypothetical protein
MPSLKQTLVESVSKVLAVLGSLGNLPATAVKLAVENVIVKELAKYLSQFLGIMGVSLDGNLLTSIAFCLVAVISYWLMNWVTALIARLTSGLSSDREDKESKSELCCGDCWCEDDNCSDSLCHDTPCELN